MIFAWRCYWLPTVLLFLFSSKAYAHQLLLQSRAPDARAPCCSRTQSMAATLHAFLLQTNQTVRCRPLKATFTVRSVSFALEPRV